MPFTLSEPGVGSGSDLSGELTETTLQVESSELAPAKSRSHLAGFRAHLEPRYDDVVLIVSELVSNSVRHTDTIDIGIKLRLSDDTIRVEVSDDGGGFSTDAPRGEGMGLTLVDKIAARWGLILDGRFTVWVELAK